MSDQHYATDVLTGMAAGGLAGWLIPKLHKPDRTASSSVVAPPAAPAVVASVPFVLLGGRSAALVTVGSIGGWAVRRCSLAMVSPAPGGCCVCHRQQV
jgi:hypothetical protein